VDFRSAGLDPSQPATEVCISKESARDRNETVAHEIDGQDETPHIGQSHHERLDGGEVEAILDGDVDQAHDSTAKNRQVITAVGAQRVQETIFRFAVPRIDKFAQKRKDDPVRRRLESADTKHTRERERWAHGPRQEEYQPVCNPPQYQDHAVGQPYSPGRTSIPRAGREIDGDEKDDTGGERQGQEDRDGEVGGGGAQGEEAPEEEQDEEGDGEEGEGEEDTGADGHRGGGDHDGQGSSEIRSGSIAGRH